MRGPIRKELMKCFEHELLARWPHFTLFDSERDFRIWSWKIKTNLVLFVAIQAFEREDQFVVEVSWNETNDFPWGAMGKLNVDKSQGRERLGRLWKSGGDEPLWDVSPEKTAWMLERIDALSEGRTISSIPEDPPLSQALPRVLSLVRDAIEKFDEYGMKLFRRVAEARGIAIRD